MRQYIKLNLFRVSTSKETFHLTADTIVGASQKAADYITATTTVGVEERAIEAITHVGKSIIEIEPEVDLATLADQQEESKYQQ